ncbi:MAG TPA: septation protein SepH, partial [Streptosporangiaceae bacterium]|nr:septation protein SepH [Streptosporangiaceae bacterium]
MQELRFVAVSEDGRYAVLAVPGRSARFTLPIDERLRAVALGQTSRLAQYEIEVESPLRPKEIQARIRAGETVEEIADSAGIPVERVRWFEGPVLAERAYVAEQAQASSVRRPGDSTPGPRLGDITAGRLTAVGADPENVQWDARKRGDGNWQVSLTFTSGGRLHVVEWLFDPRRRHVIPTDDNAARMSLPDMEPPLQPSPIPGAATVTQLTPRLRHEPADHGKQEVVRTAQPVAAPFTPAPAHVTPTALTPPTITPPAPAPSPVPAPAPSPAAATSTPDADRTLTADSLPSAASPSATPLHAASPAATSSAAPAATPSAAPVAAPPAPSAASAAAPSA